MIDSGPLPRRGPLEMIDAWPMWPVAAISAAGDRGLLFAVLVVRPP